MEGLLQIIRRIRAVDTAMLAHGALLLLVVATGWAAAGLVWQIYDLVDAPTSTSLIGSTAPSDRPAANTGQRAFDIQPLIAANLFGVPASTAFTTDAPTPAQQDAPETKLNLKLRGVFASTDPKHSNAVIEHGQGKQDIFFIHDLIPDVPGVSLAAVFPHKITLKRGSGYETLTMEDLAKNIGVSRPSNARTNRGSHRLGSGKVRILDRRNNVQLTRRLQNLRKKMDSNPLSLAKLMIVTPAMKNGRMLGVRVAPGQDAALFARAGLRRNDLITNINGISVDGPGALTALRDQIRTARELQLEVTRNGEQLSLVFSFENNKR